MTSDRKCKREGISWHCHPGIHYITALGPGQTL
jgi:hypothetical protein